MGDVSGVFYMCDTCVQWWREKGVSIPQGVIRKDGSCVMCCGTENVGAVPVNVVPGYDSSTWITTQEPSGEPWYLTGYIAESRRG